MDFAHGATDDILEQIKKRLKTEYDRAYKDLRAKADEYFEKFRAEDEALRKKLKSGKISKAAYNEWRTRHLIMGQRWEMLCDSMAKEIVITNQIALAYMSDKMPDVYALNYNYGLWLGETWAAYDTGFALYNRQTVLNMLYTGSMPWLPQPSYEAILKAKKAVMWNRQQITSVMTQGILQGLSIPHLARQLELVTEKNYKAAVRNARTMVTGAENSARDDVFRKIKRSGINIQKEWRATLDMRTRHNHRLLDGQVKPVDKPFEVDGIEIMYPAAPDAPAHMVYNCRCTLLARIDGLTPTARLERCKSGIAGMSYEDWKNMKEGKKIG